MSATPYTETEALLIALEDGECDRLHDYLAANFLPAELRALSRACRALSWTCHGVLNSAPVPAVGSAEHNPAGRGRGDQA